MKSSFSESIFDMVKLILCTHKFESSAFSVDTNIAIMNISNAFIVFAVSMLQFGFVTAEWSEHLRGSGKPGRAIG